MLKIMIMVLINKSNSYDLLKVLVAVAESKNFREAASKLQLSQPGVSVKLKELESQHPLPLFSLEGKRKVLTHYGRSLYEIAKTHSVLLENDIEFLHRNYASPQNLTLRLGGRFDVLKYLLPQLKFEGRLEFLNFTSSEAVEKLKQHEIDIAVSYVLPDSTEFKAKKLFSSRMHFCIHEKLLKKRNLDRHLFKDKEFIKSLPYISYRKELDENFRWKTIMDLNLSDINIRYSVEDWQMVHGLVDAGAGFAITPFYTLTNARGVQSWEIPSNLLQTFDFYAIYESSLKKVESFKSFLDFDQF